MNLTAAGYCRISDDQEGLELGVERQREDNHALAKREGLHLAQMFEDNDISASTRSKKKRPAYDLMMERAWAGEFDALLAYSNSRLTRRPIELEGIISLFEHRQRTGKPLRIITMVSGEDNLAMADGRMVARIKASVDAGEAERTGERVSRARRAQRDKGEPHSSRRPFGWNKDLVTLHPVESVLARSAVELLLEGVSLHMVCQAWNDAGIKTVAGGRWRYQSAHKFFHNPRIAGYVGVDGEFHLHSLTSERVVGQWEPLIDVETYEQLVARLDRFKGTGNQQSSGRTKALLSGILVCGICGTKLHASGAKGGNIREDGSVTRIWDAMYQCQDSQNMPEASTKHTMSINKAKADSAVSALVLAYLERMDLETQQAPTAWPGQAEIDGKRARTKTLLEAFADGDMSEDMVFPIVRKLNDEIRELEGAKRQWSSATLPQAQRISVHEWESMNDTRKRAYVERLFNSLVVKPAVRGKHFDPSRIVPVWNEA